MPTSSTAKLIAKRQQRSGPNAPTSSSSPRRFRSRPKSCKYDSYRLRSRVSAVDESLFGEPLKNQLLSRSKSMEALAKGAGARSRPQSPAEPAARVARQQRRPKTALATMTSSNKLDPEFESCSSVHVITRDQVRSLIVPRNNVEARPLVITRSDFEQILRAAKGVRTNRTRIQKWDYESRRRGRSRRTSIWPSSLRRRLRTNDHLTLQTH